MAKKGKRISLSVNQKIEILDVLKTKTKTRMQLATIYDCSLSAIDKVTRNETLYRQVALENGNTNRKRIRKGMQKESVLSICT